MNFVMSKLVVGFFIDLMKNIISDSSSTIIESKYVAIAVNCGGRGVNVNRRINMQANRQHD